MPTNKWLFGTHTELGTNLLVGLVNSTSDTTGIVLSAAIDNSALLYQYIHFEVNLGVPAAAYTAGAFIALFAVPTYNGTNYVDAVDVSELGGLFLASIPIATPVVEHRGGSAIAPIPFSNFKILAQNKTGQTLNATTAQLKYRLFADQSV